MKRSLLLAAFLASLIGCASDGEGLGAARRPDLPPPPSASIPMLPLMAATAAASARVDTPPPPAPYRSDEPADLLVRDGTVIDGTAAPGRLADVVVRGDKIVWVGAVAPDQRTKETVDAKGLVVTPGFVDAHAHADPLGGVDVLLAMGVTTIVLGQDGRSPAERIGPWLTSIDAGRPRVNVATLVGHATARGATGVGAKRGPTDADLDKMAAFVARGMDEGAFGLSTGLEYEPGSIADAAELAAIAKPVGARGGLVMSHLRSEDDDKLEASLEELFAQCRASGARAHVAHLKVVLGHGEPRGTKVLEMLTTARSTGLAVTADIYPYTASYTTVGILFPLWAKPPANARAAASQRRDELLRALHEKITLRNGPESTLFGTGKYAGKTLADVAKTEGRPFEDVLLDVGPDGASAAYFVMDEAIVRRLFTDPYVMVGTDGGGGLHPRGAGAVARVIAEYVVKDRLVSMEEAARKMAHLPMETLGLGGERGLVRAGYFADLAIFDPTKVRDHATFAAPQAQSTGMSAVVVNGVVALKDGQVVRKARAGRALRRLPKPSAP